MKFFLRTILKFCLHHFLNSNAVNHSYNSLFAHSVYSLTMVQATYKNSPEYFKKLQNDFKSPICDTEPKLQDSGIENYAYGYHSSSAVIDRCSFGSSHWHLNFEYSSPEDTIVFFLPILLRQYPAS